MTIWLHGTSTESGLEDGDTIDPSMGSFESCVWAAASAAHADEFAHSRSSIDGADPVVYRIELHASARVLVLDSAEDIESAISRARDDGYDAIEIRRGERGSPELAILTRCAIAKAMDHDAVEE